MKDYKLEFKKEFDVIDAVIEWITNKLDKEGIWWIIDINAFIKDKSWDVKTVYGRKLVYWFTSSENLSMSTATFLQDLEDIFNEFIELAVKKWYSKDKALIAAKAIYKWVMEALQNEELEIKI